MKKVSLILTAVALTVGLSSAIANTASKHVGKFANTVFRYTSGGVFLFSATRPTAQDNLGCLGSVNVCAKAYSTAGSHPAVPSENVFFN